MDTPVNTHNQPSSSTCNNNSTSQQNQSSSKQSRTRLTFAQKINVLKRIDKGERQGALARELGCSRRAIARLKQERAFFTDLELQQEQLVRKSRHRAKHSTLEHKLSQLLCSARRNGFPITSNHVRHAGRQIRDQLLADNNFTTSDKSALQSFQASVNWSKSFAKRYDLKSLENKEQGPSLEHELMAKRDVKKRLLEYELESIFVIEKCQLFYQIFPKQAIASMEPPPASREQPQLNTNNTYARVTLLVATNTTGNIKIPVTIIGNEESPSCFKKKTCVLPYLSQQNGWIDEQVLKTWFYSVFLPAVRQHTSSKVALLIDKRWASLDIIDSSGQVEIIGLPIYDTSEHQPMNMGIITCLRKKYRFFLLDILVRTITSSEDDNKRSTNINSSIIDQGISNGKLPDLNDLVEFLYRGWETITSEFIGKCWVTAAVLPDQYSAKLLELYGRHMVNGDDELFLSSCNENERNIVQYIENFITIRLSMEEDISSTTTTTNGYMALQKLENIGKKQLDEWLTFETSPKSQRAMSAEWESILARYLNTTSSSSTTITKQTNLSTAEQTTMESNLLITKDMNCNEKNGNELPNINHLMNLLSPIQSVLEECNSGNAISILEALKNELIRVKSQQDKNIQTNCIVTDASLMNCQSSQ